MTLKIAFTVDDVHPEVGFGLLLENDPLCYLKELNKEFGAKFTLFVTPLWANNPSFSILNNTQWYKILCNLPYCEIAQHGLTHQASIPQAQAQEFYNLPSEEVEKRIVVGKEMMEKFGKKIVGFKSPGWTTPPFTYNILKNHGFKYIVDHFLGTTPINHNGIYRVPYTFSIDKIFHTEYQEGYLIFHSHISRKDETSNGWDETLYKHVQGYLRYIVNNIPDVQFVTLSELVADYEKNQINGSKSS